jgi:hypothetical protein
MPARYLAGIFLAIDFRSCYPADMDHQLFANAPLRLVDSITDLSAEDQGCLAVSGSHGGLSSARYAVAAKPLLSVFNDAGVGKASAGIAGLKMMQEHGLAACTVSHTSACIGLASSTYESGVISFSNSAAQALGAVVGMRLRSLLTK